MKNIMLLLVIIFCLFFTFGSTAIAGTPRCEFMNTQTDDILKKIISSNSVITLQEQIKAGHTFIRYKVIKSFDWRY